MFGILRTTLAMMVTIYHLFGGQRPLGTYAVFGFYVISGYLMTLVMQEQYGYTARGRQAFALNRALRLYPQYWAACGLVVALIAFYGTETILPFNAVMFLPPTWVHAACNLLMVFPNWHGFEFRPRLVPSIWAVTVEMFFYALICLGISRNLRRVSIWCAISIVYVIITVLAQRDWQDRYFPVAAASLPFSVGSAVYFLSRDQAWKAWFARCGWTASRFLTVMLANCAMWMALIEWSGQEVLSDFGQYLNVVLFAGLVFCLATGDQFLPVSKSIDKLIGDLSYPFYLFHWQAAMIATHFLFGEMIHETTWRGAGSLCVSLPLLLAISLLSIRLIDVPIERLRQWVKHSAGNAPRAAQPVLTGREIA